MPVRLQLSLSLSSRCLALVPCQQPIYFPPTHESTYAHMYIHTYIRGWLMPFFFCIHVRLSAAVGRTLGMLPYIPDLLLDGGARGGPNGSHAWASIAGNSCVLCIQKLAINVGQNFVCIAALETKVSAITSQMLQKSHATLFYIFYVSGHTFHQIAIEF